MNKMLSGAQTTLFGPDVVHLWPFWVSSNLGVGVAVAMVVVR
jgi:hypothetical protein